MTAAGVGLSALGEAEAGKKAVMGWEVEIVKSKPAARKKPAPKKAAPKKAANPAPAKKHAAPEKAPKPPAPKAAARKPSAPTKARTAGQVAPWYRPVAFADLPGWEGDDHLAAFKTFVRSCRRVISQGRRADDRGKKGPKPPPAALVAVCVRARGAAKEITSKADARAFFEENFTPHAVTKRGQTLLTGYYEPVLMGSRKPQGRFQTPIYKRPPDLVRVVDPTRRGKLKSGTLTYVRKTGTGTAPYYTRAEIESGALKGRGLELLYLADNVDVFFMQIQGSGRIKLTDGTMVRVHYDGKNGHPYRSIGQYLIKTSMLAADRVSMKALAKWLRADPARGRKVMWHNESYVFFRELKDDAGSPLGAMQVPLTPLRSLAIDTSYHALGAPIYVSAPAMKHVPGASPFNRLMVGQDVGSAIRGSVRGDIYFGSGDRAARLAGRTSYPGRFFALVANDPPRVVTTGSTQKAQK